MSKKPVRLSPSPKRKRLQTKTNVVGIFAVLAQVGYGLLIDGGGSNGNSTGEADLPRLVAAAVCICLSLVLWILTASSYAQSKGYSKWWGTAGLLSCCRVILLVILPNRWIDDPGPLDYRPGDYPRPNG